MAKILVTGATGCLGNRLARDMVAQGHRVIAQGRNKAAGDELAINGIEFSAFDLRDTLPDDVFAGVDIVHHCAALSTAWGNVRDFEAINVQATENLLRLARKSGVARFVFASSPSIYANGEDRLDIIEDAHIPDKFATPYARTKYEAECMVLAADDKNGMRTSAIRPRAIYGIGDRSLMPRLLAAIRRGRVPMIDGGKSLIDITHVSDAALAMNLAAIKEAACGEIFNITSGKAYRFCDLLDAVCALTGARPRKIKLSYKMAMLIAKAFESIHRIIAPDREPVLTCQAVVSLGRSLTLNIDKARNLLGYEPRISMEEGIKDYVL